MAERPIVNLKNARVIRIAAGAAVRKGFAVKRSTTKVVEAAAVGDDAIGIALDAAGADGDMIRVAEFGFPGIVPALVGTGGCTQGSHAKWVSDGATNATIGGGSTKLRTYGTWEETGVVGDLAALNIGTAATTVGS
jgi:hypothetical protein